MTSVLITGGSSPLGERILHLLDGELHLTCLARTPDAARRITDVRPEARTVTGDLTDPGWTEYVAGADVILHVAGVAFAEQLLGADLSGRRVVVVSSASVANPHHPLATTVHANEERIAEAAGDAVVLRPTMIYGSPRDRNLRRLAGLVDRMPRVPNITGGGQIQPVHCDDIAGLAARAAHGEIPPGTHWAGGADAVTIGELIQLIADGLGKARLGVRVPVDPAAKLVARFDLGTRNKALHALEMLTTDRRVDPIDEGLLGRPPLPLVEGVPRALEAYGMIDSHQTPGVAEP